MIFLLCSVSNKRFVSSSSIGEKHGIVSQSNSIIVFESVCLFVCNHEEMYEKETL